MSDEGFDWREFLRRWAEEWVPREDAEEGEDGGGAVVPPGRDGAGEAAIAAAEERLGRRLPPSYRAFLSVSDGWYVDEGAGIHRLGGVAEIDWFRDPYDMTSLYEDMAGDEPDERQALLAGMWRRALRLETDSDMSHALLDPGDTDADGEWALYVYKGWGGEIPVRYPSFRAYMEAMYRGFHGDRARQAGFVNATTRAQDAAVAEGRLLALRGRYEEALPLLEEAAAFGRPDGAVLLGQLRQLLAPEGFHDYGGLVADDRYRAELLPVAATRTVSETWRTDGDVHWTRMMTARGVARETAEAVLAGMRDGSHRYAPPGAWGRAVAEARELARQGATDAAWRVLREAVAAWQAPGPSLIAPVGLLADPVLGPLVTAERGRELLATPRSGERGPAPVPVPDLDPPGLAWLAEPAAGRRRPFDSYRCVWAEGVDPERLPALVGEEGAVLSAPMDPRLASRQALRPHERDGVELWEDRAVVAAGRTGEGWAFAFDGYAHHCLSALFLSPARAASVSGRAVAVWRDPGELSAEDRPAAFHVSVAERGEELYAFTVRGSEIECSGAVPEALDPVRLAGERDGEETGGDDVERRVLRALHAELGLSLPRFALTRGRLSTFTTRSWTRAPRAGESYGYLRFVRR